MSARLLVRLLREPDEAIRLADDAWTGAVAAARAERLLGTLARRLEHLSVPDRVAAIFADARLDAEADRRAALWEVDRARMALRPLGIVPILLKGAAYAAAGLDAGAGRRIGDLDILVPRDRLDDAEAALLAAGWEWVKPDPYDDAYYRRWMHELPPLIHATRDRMIDVHHAILPLTARPTPDMAGMMTRARPVGDGLAVLADEDMVVHAAAHLMADGDLAGGLRNLWDIDRLVRQFGQDRPAFVADLRVAARHHGLAAPVDRALRIAHRLFGTPLPPGLARERWSDRLFEARLLDRDSWSRQRNRTLGAAFYARSHLLRMPPPMLARHLWTKWRKGHRPV